MRTWSWKVKFLESQPNWKKQHPPLGSLEAFAIWCVQKKMWRNQNIQIIYIYIYIWIYIYIYVCRWKWNQIIRFFLFSICVASIVKVWIPWLTLETVSLESKRSSAGRTNSSRLTVAWKANIIEGMYITWIYPPHPVTVATRGFLWDSQYITLHVGFAFRSLSAFEISWR